VEGARGNVAEKINSSRGRKKKNVRLGTEDYSSNEKRQGAH